MSKENLEKAISDQQKIGRIHKLIAVLFSFSSSESPSENGFSTNASESSDDKSGTLASSSVSPGV